MTRFNEFHCLNQTPFCRKRSGVKHGLCNLRDRFIDGDSEILSEAKGRSIFTERVSTEKHHFKLVCSGILLSADSSTKDGNNGYTPRKRVHAGNL